MRGYAPLLLACLSLWVGGVSAQVSFGCDCDGAQETPPVATSAFGWGEFRLNNDNSLSYVVESHGLVATAAHIHIGPQGTPGGVLEGLTGGPSRWAGTTQPLSTANLALLRGDGLYVNIHTAANPAGEIRGQIVARPVTFGSALDSAQATPPNNSAARGTASLVVNANRTITYNVTHNVANVTVAHIHVGAFGTPGGVAFPLTSTGPTSFAGTTSAMTAAQFATLQSEGHYINIHSTAAPSGEIRGQIVASGVPYGAGCPTSRGPATLTATGAPMGGGTITVTMTGGIPNQSGFLFGSFSAGAGDLLGCPFLIGAPALMLPLPVDAAGSATFALPWPGVPARLDFYFQWFGIDPAAPNSFYSTNGVKIPITNL